VRVTVAHTVFTNEENGWAVLRCCADDGRRFAAVGPLLGIHDGDELLLDGRWVQHPRFGEQLEVASFVHVDPTTLGGIRRYLASGRVRGIGPKLAARLVEAFGIETLAVIDNRPERLLEVPGIGRKTVERVRTSWAEHRGMQRIMVFLVGHGVSPAIAARVHRRYGASAMEVVRSSPYRLAQEVFGVGFLTADRMARSLGLPEDAPDRLEAGILHALGVAGDEGHVLQPRDRLLEAAGALLDLDPAGLDSALDRLAARGAAVVRDRAGREPAVYLPRLARAEDTVAERVATLLRPPPPPVTLDVGRAVAWYEAGAGIRLADRQREALATALTSALVVVTGGPGTGKTTLVRGVTRILGAKEQRIELAAPTGRAAKRLAETTGQPARTVHRLLEFSPVDGLFARGSDNPLDADLVVVDEASMLDVELAAALLAAVPAGCRLVLVGDSDQLPSVGPGNVLGDLIASGVVPVVRLDRVFRQADRSLIVDNAHRVNRGEMPVSADGDELRDFYFVERDEAERAADTAVEMVASRIPRRFGLDPVDDVQLLSPMHRGELGVAALNDRVQARVNPDGPELVIGARLYRLGDKVMQTRNNYELEVFNGDIGRIASVDTEQQTLVVRFDDRLVEIGRDGLDDLVPAYACTIHKAQGSEYPAVVVALHHQHHVMLQRNLLYTAITRGRRLVVLVGSRRALRRAVANAAVRQRQTMLAERLASR